MIASLAQDIHATAVSKGFWDTAVTPDFVLAKLALVHSELSEILEAYRKEQGIDKVTEEFADVLIRLLDLWAGLHELGLVLDIDDAIAYKTELNKSRPHKHGNLI